VIISNKGHIGEDKACEIIMVQAPEAAKSDVVIRRDTNDGAVVYEGTVATEGRCCEWNHYQMERRVTGRALALSMIR